MIVFPNCKINIGLRIVNKRSDGYHNLETIFYPVKNLQDVLEILPKPPSSSGNNHSDLIMFEATGIRIDGHIKNNLCIQAYELLKKDFPQLQPINMHLHKTIPLGAGLGGGSANGAFALTLLNQLFNLQIPTQLLQHYALQLGSDAPFFILNQPCLAHNRGEVLQPISLNLTGYQLVLIYPHIHVNTGWAFSQIAPNASRENLAAHINEPIENWRQLIENDFETVVFKTHPSINQIKNQLYHNGALYAAMSGSGSAVYGIFKAENMPTKKLFTNYVEHHIEL